MDGIAPGSLLLSLALLVGVAFFVARPFLMPASLSRHRIQANNQKQKLLAEKEALLTQLQALEFDLATGKVPQEIYKTQRDAWTSQAAGILRQLDHLEQTAPTPTAIDRQIEEIVHRMRLATPTSVANQQPSSGHQPSVAHHSFRFCPQCGQPIDPNDNFCAGCGRKLMA